MPIKLARWVVTGFPGSRFKPNDASAHLHNSGRFALEYGWKIPGLEKEKGRLRRWRVLQVLEKS